MIKIETPDRLEALSDAIFGLALTFLVVKMEIPKNFTEFEAMSHGFIGFFLTFIMLFYIWNKQGRVLRSIKHIDGWLKSLVACFLFLILYYVFPLKYLFTLSTEMVLEPLMPENTFVSTLSVAQITYLIKVYAVSVGGIFLLNALMFAYCLWQQQKLVLQRSELDIWLDMSNSIITATVAGLSFFLACILSPHTLHYAGLVYLIMIPAQFGSKQLLLRRHHVQQHQRRLNASI